MRSGTVAFIIAALTVIGAFAALTYEGNRGWEASYSNYNLYTTAQISANDAERKVSELEQRISQMEQQLASATTTSSQNAALQDELRKAKYDLSFYRGQSQSAWPTMYANANSTAAALRVTAISQRPTIITVTDYVDDANKPQVKLIRFNPEEGNPDCGTGCLTIYMKSDHPNAQFMGLRLVLQVVQKCGTIPEGFHCSEEYSAEDYGFYTYPQAESNNEGVLRFTNVAPDALVQVMHPLTGEYIEITFEEQEVNGSELPATRADIVNTDDGPQLRTRAGYEAILELNWTPVQ